MERTTLDLWVGVFVAAGLAALLLLAFKVGNMGNVNLSDGYTVTAGFDDIGGLKPRAPVKSAGVVVGRVSQIAFDDKTYEATVTLNLDKRYTFPKDTIAAMRKAGHAQYRQQEIEGADHFFVGVEAENPVVRRALGGELFLRGKAGPFSDDHARAERSGDLARAVVAFRIND